MEQQVFCVSFRKLYCKWNRHLKVLDHIQLDTHTHTSDKWSARRTGRSLQNTQQTQQTNIHALRGIRNSDFRKSRSCTIGLRLYDNWEWPVHIYINKSFLIWSSDYGRREINIYVDIKPGIGISKNYKHANNNFPTNTAHSYQTERHFINKAKFAQLVQVLEINKQEESQKLDFLKYAYSS